MDYFKRWLSKLYYSVLKINFFIVYPAVSTSIPSSDSSLLLWLMLYHKCLFVSFYCYNELILPHKQNYHPHNQITMNFLYSLSLFFTSKNFLVSLLFFCLLIIDGAIKDLSILLELQFKHCKSWFLISQNLLKMQTNFQNYQAIFT